MLFAISYWSSWSWGGNLGFIILLYLINLICFHFVPLLSKKWLFNQKSMIRKLVWNRKKVCESLPGRSSIPSKVLLDFIYVCFDRKNPVIFFENKVVFYVFKENKETSRPFCFLWKQSGLDKLLVKNSFFFAKFQCST